jgi:hypothetical protein
MNVDLYLFTDNVCLKSHNLLSLFFVSNLKANHTRLQSLQRTTVDSAQLFPGEAHMIKFGR